MCFACRPGFLCDGSKNLTCNYTLGRKSDTVSSDDALLLKCTPTGLLCEDKKYFLNSTKCKKCPEYASCDGSAVASCTFGGTFPDC